MFKFFFLNFGILSHLSQRVFLLEFILSFAYLEHISSYCLLFSPFFLVFKNEKNVVIKTNYIQLYMYFFLHMYSLIPFLSSLENILTVGIGVSRLFSRCEFLSVLLQIQQAYWITGQLPLYNSGKLSAYLFEYHIFNSFCPPSVISFNMFHIEISVKNSTPGE